MVRKTHSKTIMVRKTHSKTIMVQTVKLLW